MHTREDLLHGCDRQPAEGVTSHDAPRIDVPRLPPASGASLGIAPVLPADAYAWLHGDQLFPDEETWALPGDAAFFHSLSCGL